MSNYMPPYKKSGTSTGSWHASDVLGVYVVITSSSTLVQRLNTEERNILSLVQWGFIGEFLGRLGIA